MRQYVDIITAYLPVYNVCLATTTTTTIIIIIIIIDVGGCRVSRETDVPIFIYYIIIVHRITCKISISPQQTIGYNIPLSISHCNISIESVPRSTPICIL